jgi:hypothetical protein
MTRSLLIFWLLGSLALLSLFLCCLLSLLSHLDPPLQVGLCGRNGPRHYGGFCRLALSLARAGTAFSPCCRPFLVIAPR